MKKINFPLDPVLRKDLRAYLAAKASGDQLLDCFIAEIDGDIRACLNAGTLTPSQADLIEKIMQE